MVEASNPYTLDRLKPFRWRAFSHAYGHATNAPDLIEDVLFGRGDRYENAVYGGLHSSFFHQYTIYTSTPYAIAFLATALIEGNYLKDDIPRVIDILGFIKSCAEQDSQPLLEYLPGVCLFTFFLRTGIRKLSIKDAVCLGKDFYKEVTMNGTSEEKELAAWLSDYCKPS